MKSPLLAVLIGAASSWADSTGMLAAKSCRVYYGALSTIPAQRISFTQRPAEFLALLRNDIDPKRELTNLQSKNETTPYGEFFGANQINHVFR